jgi:hypothetical protein
MPRGVIVIATVVVVVVDGVAISPLDGEEYPNFGIGMWCVADGHDCRLRRRHAYEIHR